MSSCWLKSHLASLMPTCALKIDIRKYFYMVSWEFILTMLRAIGVPNFIVRRIEICMSTAHFLMVMNGESRGLFPSFKGLLQGDPLSFYLFVLSIKVLGSILREVSQNSRFWYHWQCQQSVITHLYFADDLMIFYQANINSIGIVRKALNDFATLFGLITNLEKTHVFLSWVYVKL